MNIRDFRELNILPSQSRDNAASWQIDRYVALAVLHYRDIRGCGDYRPNKDADSPAPCHNCGRPASEHGEQR